jgi:hypothetical protein
MNKKNLRNEAKIKLFFGCSKKSSAKKSFGFNIFRILLGFILNLNYVDFVGQMLFFPIKVMAKSAFERTN